jgi:small-conductance mechanosensitive channel
MIGSASSKYFEGLLFIIMRRPYGIGDMIHISNVEQDTQIECGSPCWIVQHVTLFETIVTWIPTMERASLSNGSLASSRIINWARSPNARFNITLTFPIETRYETIEIFKRAIEEYLKVSRCLDFLSLVLSSRLHTIICTPQVRPREWLALNGFRVNHIATDKGFMQVILTVQHREHW